MSRTGELTVALCPPPPYPLPTPSLLPSFVWSPLSRVPMAKSKNHTAHNQTRVRVTCRSWCCAAASGHSLTLALPFPLLQKAHRNGIKKPKTNKYPSLKGVRWLSHFFNAGRG